MQKSPNSLRYGEKPGTYARYTKTRTLQNITLSPCSELSSTWLGKFESKAELPVIDNQGGTGMRYADESSRRHNMKVALIDCNELIRMKLTCEIPAQSS